MSSSPLKTLVYQSFRTENIPRWIQRSMESVSSWAHQEGFEYRRIGDEIFDLNPAWFHQKVGQRRPILSDLARLKYAKIALQEYERVIWLDADVFVFAPEVIELPDDRYAFGRECWTQPYKTGLKSHKTGLKSHKTGLDNKGAKEGWRVYENICNALSLFERESSFLDFYIYSCERIIDRADPQFIAPQMIGPKLLSALHNIVHLPFTYSVGSASPHVLYDLSQGGGEALDFMNQALLRRGVLCGALNLCHSLVETPISQEEMITEELIERAMDELLIRGYLGSLRVD